MPDHLKDDLAFRPSPVSWKSRGVSRTRSSLWVDVLSHWQKQWISPGGKLPCGAFILKKITGDFLTIGNFVG